ncbi:MAG: glycosyltransferase family 2 protein [Rhodobacteraceae bacterium]|nr:glycosyltransferase family 2 protein [Paracoccaceae bacterium]
MRQNNHSNTQLNPLVSVVMPAYNSKSTINQSIHSVLAQTYENWELLIIDDASSDNTAALILEEHADARIRLIKNDQNLGPAKSRNIGLDNANGDYIAFLDADDFWAKEKLKTQMAFMMLKECTISFTSYWRVDETGLNKLYEKTAAPEIGYNNLLDHNGIGCLTAIFDRRKLPEIRFLDPSEFIKSGNVNGLLKRLLKGRVGHEDYVFWLSALRPAQGRPTPIAHGIDIPLAFYRVSTSSFSGNKFQAAIYQWFIYRYVEKLPLWRSIQHFSRYALKGIYTQLRSR